MLGFNLIFIFTSAFNRVYLVSYLLVIGNLGNCMDIPAHSLLPVGNTPPQPCPQPQPHEQTKIATCIFMPTPNSSHPQDPFKNLISQSLQPHHCHNSPPPNTPSLFTLSILPLYSAHTSLILPSYSPHTSLILLSYSPHTSPHTKNELK